MFYISFHQKETLNHLFTVSYNGGGIVPRNGEFVVFFNSFTGSKFRGQVDKIEHIYRDDKTCVNILVYLTNITQI